MQDVPTPGRPRRAFRYGSEIGRSGLLGSALAMGTRPSLRGRAAGSRPTTVRRPSDAIVAECTCPVACIRDHEHE